MTEEQILLDEIKELCKALQFYADKKSYRPWTELLGDEGQREIRRSAPVVEDGGERARKALEPWEPWGKL